MNDDTTAIGIPQSLSDRVITLQELMIGKGLRLAVAESCTGGGLAATLTAISGASRWFEGGIVTYSNTAKTQLLDVDTEIIETQGAVSESVCGQMASGARARFATDLALSTTGIAGPSGATPDKPVGLVYIALACPTEVLVSRCLFQGPRATVQACAIRKALDMLLNWLKDIHQQREN